MRNMLGVRYILTLLCWVRGTNPSTFERKRARAHQIAQIGVTLDLVPPPSTLYLGSGSVFEPFRTFRGCLELEMDQIETGGSDFFFTRHSQVS